MLESSPSEDELFADALDLPPAERNRFVAERCMGNEPLREQVESLLRSSANAGEFLEASPVPEAPKLLSSLLFRTDEAPDGIIGPYLLRQRLGEGGCGVVYLAEQERPLRRSVALKVIKPGMDTKAVIARFEAERQALAMMEHPHIARVFDAGVTPMGRPFFAMELVPGIKVTDYCHQGKLTVAERLELFLPICRAVQHAHQKGIIHRDLKPSNILITLQDGEPVPKLIDFGIAKATQGRLTELTLLTSTEQFIGTPAYMSPEQLGVAGRDVDTRSDLYSLGVVLYELLTGAPPFGRLGSKEVNLEEWRRQIREDDPLRPSSALSRTDHALYYPLSPAKNLTGQLRGDLDWIVLRCLERDPNLRYQSAHELSCDLEKFLADEPLPNRPSDAWQSFGKFVRRHRSAVAIGVGMLAVLVTATSVSTWEAFRATRAERLAQKAEVAAQTEAATNKAVLDFLRSDLLPLASPRSELDGNVKLRTLVDHASQKLDAGDFANQPRVETEIRRTLANTYQSMGLYAAAEHHWNQILSSNQILLGPKDPLILTARRNLVVIYFMEGKYIKAEDLAVKLLPLYEKVFGPEHEDTLSLANRLAWVYWGQGKTEQAEKLLLPTIAALKRTMGAEVLSTLQSMYTLSVVYRIQGRTEEEETLLRQLREVTRRTRGPDDAMSLVVMHALGSVYLDLDRLTEAEPLFDEVYASYNRKWGPEFPETILAKEHLAFLYLFQARLTESDRYFTELTETARRSIGPDHLYTIDGLTGLARVRRYQGQLDEAETLALQAKNDKIRAFGPNGILLSSQWDEMGEIREAQGNLVEAEACYSAALESGKSYWRPGHRDRLSILQSLGRISLKELKLTAAENILRECLVERTKALGQENWLTHSARSLLGETLLKMHRVEEATLMIEESDRELKRLAETIPPIYRTVLKESEDRQLELHRAVGHGNLNDYSSGFAPSR